MSTKPGPCAFCVVDECGHVCTGACDKLTAAPTRTEPTECNDNDSPWLICKTCVADGKCARTTRTEFEAAAYRWLRDNSEPGICAFYLSVGMGLHGVRFTKETVDTAIAAAMGWSTHY